MQQWTWAPPWNRWLVYLRYVILLDILFVAVYGGSGWLAAHRVVEPVDFYFGWELGIPFVPWLIYVYLSISVLFLLPLFALDETALGLLARRIACAVLISGVVFLLMPTHLGFPREVSISEQWLLFRIIYAIDPPHNLFPSLHVAYSTLIIAALIAHSPLTLRRLFLLWLGLICLSVVLVHQHHVLDVPGGLLVAWVSARLVKDRSRKHVCAEIRSG